MVYTKVSKYEYITGDQLEAKAMQTYVNVDARYTEAAVMEQVSQAERWVNEYCGQIFSGTIPDGVEFATLEMAKYLMDKQMLDDNHIKELPTKLSEILEICKTPLERNKVSITYSNSASDFNLNNLAG